MRKKLNITEGIFPMPVLMVATYNEDGSINVMNAAWGTMQERGNVALNLTETHKTVKNDHFVLAGYQGQRITESRILKIRLANIILYHLTLSFKIVLVFSPLPATIICTDAGSVNPI